MRAMTPARPLRPIALSLETIAKCSGPDEFQSFDKMFRFVVAVPEAQIEKAEARWKLARKRTLKADLNSEDWS
jgi:hypothetical protein